MNDTSTMPELQTEDRTTTPPGQTGGLPNAQGNDHVPETKDAPRPDAAQERGRGGRFAPGNKGGPGNPYARRITPQARWQIPRRRPDPPRPAPRRPGQADAADSRPASRVCVSSTRHDGA